MEHTLDNALEESGTTGLPKTLQGRFKTEKLSKESIGSIDQKLC